MAGGSCTVTITAILLGVATDITADTILADGLRIAYGIPGNGPTDCVAGTGEASFTLNNIAGPGRLQGAYSPGHANCRPGWDYGTEIYVQIRDSLDTTLYTKHRGRVGVIDPDAGQYGNRRVRVVSYDAMRELMSAEVRSLALQQNKTESELVAAIIAALPAESRPGTSVLATGVDTYRYAFHDVGSGTKALGLIKDVAIDSYALVVVTGDGPFRMFDRHTRITKASSFTLNDTMQEFVAPSTLDQAVSVARLTIHPPSFDTANVTLYADQSVRELAPATTTSFWVTYRDPNTSTTLIGGRSVVTSLVADSDYAGNSKADGTGTVLTSSLAVTVTAFASTALVSIVNSSPQSVFLANTSGHPTFRIRGLGVYDRGPQTYESSSTQSYGVRPLTMDLRYQDNPLVAQNYAEFLVITRKALASQPQRIGFIATGSPTLMTQALAREPGDVITVSETMTGFSSVKAAIQSVEITVTNKNWLHCRWGLAPSNTLPLWLFDTVGSSEWGVSTYYGF